MTNSFCTLLKMKRGFQSAQMEVLYEASSSGTCAPVWALRCSNLIKTGLTVVGLLFAALSVSVAPLIIPSVSVNFDHTSGHTGMIGLMKEY